MADNLAQYKAEQYLKDFYNLSNQADIKGFYYETRLHSVIVLEITLALIITVSLHYIQICHTGYHKEQ